MTFTSTTTKRKTEKNEQRTNDQIETTKTLYRRIGLPTGRREEGERSAFSKNELKVCEFRDRRCRSLGFTSKH
jgi:hypothetical protein